VETALGESKRARGDAAHGLGDDDVLVVGLELGLGEVAHGRLACAASSRSHSANATGVRRRISALALFKSVRAETPRGRLVRRWVGVPPRRSPASTIDHGTRTV